MKTKKQIREKLLKDKHSKIIIENNIITCKFGRSSRIKILEFLINNKNEAWGLKEIIKYARVKYRTAVLELKDLLKEDLIFIDKKLGKSLLYKINELDPYVQSLVFTMEMKK